MSDVTTTGNPTPQGEESTNPKVAKPTLKLLCNKTHIGPVSEGKVAKTELSKATGKVMFNNQLQVVVKQERTETDTKQSPKQKIDIPLLLDPGMEATKYFLAWDRYHKSEIGTPNYQEKYKAFLVQQKATYESLGISIATDSKGRSIKPELTEQQRSIYNKEMRPFSFSYYETRLSYKSPGVKAVRTLTFRTLNPPDLEKIAATLRVTVKGLDEKITVKRKSSVNS